MFVKPRTLPSIEAGSPARLANISFYDDHVIIQEKVDGSQLTVFRDGHGELHFYNRSKPCNPKTSAFMNAWLSIQSKKDSFREGLYYHGEAFTSRFTNTCKYDRAPKFFWMVYEIVTQENRVLSPAEMAEVLEGTGFETVQLIYDSERDGPVEDLQLFIDCIMLDIEESKLLSSLGRTPEGVVLKVLNNGSNENGFTTTRCKYVRPVFSEMNHSKKERLPSLSDAEFIQELGKVYDTDARRQKAFQHLKEAGLWKEKLESNIPAMIAELDADLLKEEEEQLKNLLFVRFWPIISKNARGDVLSFLKKK